MMLGRLGVWAGLDAMTAADGLTFAQRVEKRGYKALWMPEGLGRNALVHAAWLLAGTSTLVVATGIANIYARDLEAMRAAPYQAPSPPERPLTVLAALGPKMLALAAELADGAHTYCVTPEHTAEARGLLGPAKLLCPELMVLLETDPAKARSAARMALARYIQLENYANNWRRLGFADDDLAGGGSNRFVDANVAWGDEGAIRQRLRLFWDAGADHVCIQSIRPHGSQESIDERIFDLLAPST